MNLSTSIEPGNGRLAAKVEIEWISHKIFVLQLAKHSALHINNQERTFQYTGNPLSSLLDLAFRRHVVERPLDLLVPRHLSSVGHVGGSAEDLGQGGVLGFCSDTRTRYTGVSVVEQLEMMPEARGKIRVRSRYQLYFSVCVCVQVVFT
jgi:hypothetical protein